MRFHTYGKYNPELADAIDLQALLDKLADFLLQSGFANNGDNQSYYGWDAGDENNHSLEALKQAILDALMESGQFTPEMLEALRGGDDEEGQARQAARRARAAVDRGGLPQPRERAEDARRPPAGHRAGQHREGRRPRRPVQPHRERHRLPRL